MPAPSQVRVTTPPATTVRTRAPLGTYQPNAGSTACLPAPPGSFVDQQGATAATPCPVGTYQPDAGSVSCLRAPAGTFVAVQGAVQPTPCASGYEQLLTGQSSCVLDGTQVTSDVMVADSQGNPIEGAHIAYAVTVNSGWKTLGYTDASGVVAVPVDAGNYLLHADYNRSSAQTSAPVDISGPYTFHTVPVTLLNSGIIYSSTPNAGWLAYHGPMQMFPGTGVLSDGHGSVSFTVGDAGFTGGIVRLVDHSGNGLAGGQYSYYLGGWSSGAAGGDRRERQPRLLRAQRLALPRHRDVLRGNPQPAEPLPADHLELHVPDGPGRHPARERRRQPARPRDSGVLRRRMAQPREHDRGPGHPGDAAGQLQLRHGLQPHPAAARRCGDQRPEHRRRLPDRAAHGILQRALRLGDQRVLPVRHADDGVPAGHDQPRLRGLLRPGDDRRG